MLGKGFSSPVFQYMLKFFGIFKGEKLQAQALKHLVCIPVFNDVKMTFNLIYKIHEDFGRMFPHFLIIDPLNSKPDPLVKSLLKDKAIGYEYINVLGRSGERGFIVKTALDYAYRKGFDYLTFMHEGWEDCYGELSGTLNENLFLDYSLVTGSRASSSRNLGAFIDLFSKSFFSVVFRTSVGDTKGDAFNLYKVASFVDNSSSSIDQVRDNEHFFIDFLACAFYHRQKVLFTRQKILSYRSFLKLNRFRFYTVVSEGFKYLVAPRYAVKRLKANGFLRAEVLANLGLSSTSSAIEPVKEICTETLNGTGEDNSLVANNSIEEVNPTQATKGKRQLLGPADVDPKASPLKYEHLVTEHKDVVVVNWCLTNICNYKCSYCPEDLHNGTKRGPELDAVKNFYYKIKERNPGRKIFFEFTGGEVTYYKQFPELIRFLKANDVYIGIISNGSRKIEFWENHWEFLDHVCLSFHSEQGEPEHFKRVCEFLCQRLMTHVNIMMKPEKFNFCYQLAQDIAESCEVSLSLQPLMENMDGNLYGYSDYQKAILEKQAIYFSKEPRFKRPTNLRLDHAYRGAMRMILDDGNEAWITPPELISKGLNRWAGWMCYAGLENLIVNLDGKIMRGWCGEGGIIGGIEDLTLELPLEPILCKKSQCSCGLDIMCTKIKADHVI